MPKRSISFKGKVVLVTGATRGIGKAVAEFLVDLGAHAIVTGTKPKSLFKGRNYTYLPMDASNDESVAEFLQELKKFPKIDILVNNAGINRIEEIDQISKENWDLILKVNLTVPMLLMREVSALMKKKRIKGHIVNVSSIFGMVSRSKRNSYSASKSGLIGLTRAAALDLASYGIKVNSICPGFILTDLTKSILSKREIDDLSNNLPMKRFGLEEEIASAVAFMCSDWNTYMTGQTIVVDGGMTAQ